MQVTELLQNALKVYIVFHAPCATATDDSSLSALVNSQTEWCVCRAESCSVDRETSDNSGNSICDCKRLSCQSGRNNPQGRWHCYRSHLNFCNVIFIADKFPSCYGEVE